MGGRNEPGAGLLQFAQVGKCCIESDDSDRPPNGPLKLASSPWSGNRPGQSRFTTRTAVTGGTAGRSLARVNDI